MEDFDYITTATCDLCNVKGPVRLFHQDGTPVLHTCGTCDPKNFEEVARRDIDAWLNKGNRH